MSEIYELKDPKIMGDENPTYGFTFWSETDGEYPVMFNSKTGNILPGTRIMVESATLRTSSKGNDYLRLKGVKVEDKTIPKKQTLPFTERPAPTFTKSENQYLKDVTDMPVRFMLHLLQYYDVQKLVSNPIQYQNYIETVKLLSEEALSMIENIRNSGSQSGGDLPTQDSPKATNEPKSQVAAEPTIKDKLAYSDWAPDYTDEDFPNE